jgi:uncharacterized membrane protein
MDFTVGRVLLAAIMIVAGILHFVIPKGYVRMIPRALPQPLLLVYISGVAEIAGGAGLLVPQVSRAAAWGLIALLVAVFPANINMAVNRIGLTKAPPKMWMLWARLPLQFLLIYWAWLYTR